VGTVHAIATHKRVVVTSLEATLAASVPRRSGLARLILLSLYWVALGYLWNSIGAQVLPPLVRTFVGHAHQGTALSVLEGGGTLIAVFWQPMVGAVSDRTMLGWGRRRPYITGGALGSVLSLVLMAFVGSYFWLVATYLLLQLASNTAQAPYQGLLPDAIAKEDFGKAGAFYGLGNLVGTLIGFIVVGVFVSHGRYDLALISMAVVLLVSMALTVTLIPDNAKPAGNLRRSVAAVTLGTFQINPRQYHDFLWLMGSRLFILMGIAGTETFAFFFFKDVFYPGGGTAVINLANQATTYMLAIITALTLLVTYPAARLSDRVGRRPLVAACGVLAAAGTLGLVFSHYTLLPHAMTAPIATVLHIPIGLAQVLYFGVLIGVATGSFISIDWAFMMDVIPSAEAGRFLGFSNIATAGSGIIARLVAGPILDHFNAGGRILGEVGGYPVVFGMFVIFLLIGAILVFKVVEPGRRRAAG
jgi:MFS family permease